MVAGVATVGVVAEVSTAVAAALVAEASMAADFPAVATVVARTAVITVEDTPGDAALTAAATAEDPATRVAAVPMVECAAPPAPITPGHPKVKAFATHRPAGIRLKDLVAVQPCPEGRVPRATNVA